MHRRGTEYFVHHYDSRVQQSSVQQWPNLYSSPNDYDVKWHMAGAAVNGTSQLHLEEGSLRGT